MHKMLNVFLLLAFMVNLMFAASSADRPELVEDNAEMVRLRPFKLLTFADLPQGYRLSPDPRGQSDCVLLHELRVTLRLQHLLAW